MSVSHATLAWSRVPGGRRVPLRARPCLVRFGCSIPEAQREPALKLKLSTTLAGRQQRHCSSEQGHGGADVARAPDAYPGLTETLARSRGELVRVLAELSPIAHRLLEVVAGDRVVARPSRSIQAAARSCRSARSAFVRLA